MAIKGSLKEASLPDVLQLLAMGQKTGCLSLNHRSNFGTIFFDRGRISFAAIVNRRDRLGDMLVKGGVVTQAALEEAVAAQATERGRRVGEILVARGHLSRDDLRRQVRVQIEEAVYHLFTWAEGVFNFEPDVLPEEEDMLVAINPESLLLEGARRVDEWSLIEKKIPSFDLIFTADAALIEEKQPRLTAEQALVVAHLDGHADVAAIVDATGLVEFDVGKALFGLVTAGFAHRVGKSRAADTPRVPDVRVEEHRNLGVAFYKAGMQDEALREFRRVTDLRPEDLIARFHIGLVQLRQARWDEAAETFGGASRHPSAPPAVFHNLAFALERLGRLEEARLALDDAMRRGGEADPRVQLSQAVLALRGGEPAEADRLLAAAHELWGRRTPPAVWFHYAALVAALLGDAARSATLLAEGTHAHPHAAALHNNLAATLERRGDYAGALTAAERGLLEDASLAQLHKNVGDLHYRAGRHDEALEAYQRAIRADDALGDDVYLKLGNLRFRRHETAEAERCWERALELDPENAIVRNNLAAVRRTVA